MDQLPDINAWRDVLLQAATELGTKVVHSSRTMGQRVRNAQPLGLFTGVGISPSSLTRVEQSPCGSGCGTAEINAWE